MASTASTAARSAVLDAREHVGRLENPSEPFTAPVVRARPVRARTHACLRARTPARARARAHACLRARAHALAPVPRASARTRPTEMCRILRRAYVTRPTEDVNPDQKCLESRPSPRAERLRRARRSADSRGARVRRRRVARRLRGRVAFDRRGRSRGVGAGRRAARSTEGRALEAAPARGAARTVIAMRSVRVWLEIRVLGPANGGGAPAAASRADARQELGVGDEGRVALERPTPTRRSAFARRQRTLHRKVEIRGTALAFTLAR
jgi:hypothetical protein